MGRYLLEAFPKTNVTFADFSKPMLEALQKKLPQDERSQTIRVDFSKPEWSAQTELQDGFDIIVSGFAIHHQPDERKHALFSEVFELLMPKGIFLNLEHVASQTPNIQSLFDEFFVDHLFEYNLKNESPLEREAVSNNYYNSPAKAENILATVEVQCQWLRDIGFQDVDCFFKTFELALFGGRKLAA